MLNKIWLALIVLGILTALSLDVFNSTSNKFKNNKPISAKVKFLEKNIQTDAELFISAKNFSSFYEVTQPQDIQQIVKLSKNEKDASYNLFMNVEEQSPKIWKDMAKSSGKENDLYGKLFLGKLNEDSTYQAWIVFENVSFIKMKDVTNATIDYVGKAVEIAFGLIGIMALWLGVMKIAEEAGLIKIIARVVKPFTKFLFPDVPQDHPAIGSIIMNLSANMLGLGNAATPFGLKAMEELDKLNDKKGTATNAMVTFLAINTAGLTLIPATAIAVRAASGSNNPTVIIGTSIFGATCAATIGIISAKLLEKFPMTFNEFFSLIKSSWKLITTLITTMVGIVLIVSTGIFANQNFIDGEVIKTIIQMISLLAIPSIIFSFVVFGFVKKVKVYEVFVEGAKEGFNVAIRIIPYLVAMLAAIGIFRAGGAMDFLILIISPITSLIGFPAEALPMALMRPLSGSGALGIMTETIAVHGPDSFIGILVSTLMGSTETTFYVLALYFGAVGISKMRHAVTVGILADIAGALGAFFITKILFG